MMSYKAPLLSCILFSLLSFKLLGQDGNSGSGTGQDNRVRHVAVGPGRTVELRCPVSSPSDSFTLVVQFKDEAGLSSVVQAFSKDDVSLEVKENRLFIKLLAPVRGHVDAVGSSRKLYRLYLRPAEKAQEADEYVGISSPQEEESRSKITDKLSQPPKPIRLIRSMRLLQVPPGGRVAKPAGKDAPIIHQVQDIRYRLFLTYELDELVGWVLRVENTSQDKAFDIDLSRFSGDSLVLMGSKDLFLAPGASTLVYLVFDSEER